MKLELIPRWLSTVHIGPRPQPPEPPKIPVQIYHLPAVIPDPESLDGSAVLVKNTNQRVVPFGLWFDINFEPLSPNDTNNNRLAAGFNRINGPVYRYLTDNGLLIQDQTAAQCQPGLWARLLSLVRPK